MKARGISKVKVAAVCFALVAAITAMALLSQTGIMIPDTVPAIVGEAATYPVSADGYTHGSNIGRAASGTSVSTADAFMTALNGNQSINLQSDITLSNTQAFSHSGTYSATIYGNGHTVTLTGKQSTTSGITGNIANGSNIGGLVSTLTGKVYDLNVELKSGTSASYINVSGGKSMRLGLIAGVITDGGTVENCTVTIPSGSVLAALSATGAGESDGANTGAVAGNCNGSMTIKNVTVTNNGKIIGALGTSFTSLAYRLGSGTAAMFVAFIWNDRTSYTQTMDNLVAKGNGTIEGWCCSVLGMTYASAKAITITNYYNQFTGTYSYGATSGGIFGTGSTSLVSYSLFKWKGSDDSSKIVNYYNGPNTDEGKMSTGFYAVPDTSVEVKTSEYTVGFDPKATNIASSLVVVKSGITGGENYTATIANVKSNPWVYTNNYAFSADGGTVIFRNLSTTASDWRNSGGNFACTIEITKKAVVVTPLPAVNKWESSYVPDDYTPSGEPESYESGLYDAISNNRDCYLTSDINITGFRTLSYSGILDGNGHTIYITVCNENSAETVGGLFGTLTGTVKNLRVVLYVDYTRNVTAENKATGIIAGNLNGGTVDNVYVYIPSGVTFGVTGGGQSGFLGAVAGDGSGAPYTIRNTTVDIDGTIQLNGNWVYLAAFVGRTGVGSSSDTNKFTLVNNIIRGEGHFHSTASNSAEPVYIAATTVMFPTGTTMPKIKIDGFINDFQGDVSATAYSMYGILTKNNHSGNISNAGSNYDVSNIYDYDTPLADVDKKGTGNTFINLSEIRSTVSTTVESSTVRVTPYFPAGDTDNLVLVAGDGEESVPNLEYGTYGSVADGNYKVVTIPKTAITAKSTVTLTEALANAKPIEALNQWEHGYVANPIAEEGVPEDCEAVSTAWKLKTALDSNSNIVLTEDILNFRGFTHTKEYSGILDGNGHTIYIVAGTNRSDSTIGGLFATFSGTIKNVRIVLSFEYLRTVTTDKLATGLIAGSIAGGTVDNVYVYIPDGVTFGVTGGGYEGYVGAVAGVADGTSYTIQNTTVDIDGKMHLDGTWVYLAGFVGKSATGSSAATATYTNNILKGDGSFSSSQSNGTEPIYLAATTVLFQAGTGNPQSTINIDGFIHAFKGGTDYLHDYSMYGVLTKNDNGKTMKKWTYNVSNVYDYDSPMADVNHKGTTTGNNYIDISTKRSTVSTTVESSTIKVTPYFPASDEEGRLYLVAGDGTTPAGVVVYGTTSSTFAGDNREYSLITIVKTTIEAGATVTLTRPRVSAPTLSGSDRKTYNGAGQEFTINELTATGGIKLGASDYTLAFAVEPGTGALLDGNGKPLNAGTYTLTVTLKGYFFVSGGNTATLTVYITKLAIEATIETASKVYGEDDPLVLTFTVTGSLAQGDDIEDLAVTLTREEGDTVGSYAITGESASVNYEVTFTEALFTINKRPISVNISAASKVYGVTTDPALTFTFDKEELKYSDTADALGVTLMRASGDDAGSYAINGTSSSANYAVTFVNDGAELFTINKRPLHYVLSIKNMNGNETDGYSLEYGAFNAIANLDVSIVSGEGYYAVVADERVTVTPKLPDGGVKNVGTYTIDAIDAAYGENTSPDNYEIKLDNTVSFKIVAKPVTVDIKDITKVYGDANPVFQWSLASGFFMAPGEAVTALDVTLSLKGDGENVIDGGYAITGKWNNSNYAVTFNEGTLTVNKRAITVTLKQNFSSVYGEPIVAPDISAITLRSGTLAGSLPVHNNLTEAGFSVTFNDNIKNAATYSGYISAKCENDNYEVTWTEGRYTADYIVTPRPVKYVITVQNMHEGNYLYYGEFDESRNISVTGPIEEEGFYLVVASESITVKPSYSYTAPGGEIQPFAEIIDTVKNVGTYTVTGNVIYDENTNASNYAVTVTITPSQSFRIDKRHVTITIGNYTKVYGDKDPVFDWSIPDGETVYGEDAHDVIAYSLSRDQGENKGTYEIKAVMISSVNYDVAVVKGTLTVEPKPVTVTITSATKTYGEADPDFKWTHTELANYEGTSVLGFTVTRESGEDVKEGGYALGGTATNANYDVTVEEGSVLTIDPLAVSFAVTNAQLPYNTYTVDTLPEPAGLGADAKVSGTLPYGDKANVVFDYNIDAATIVSLIAGDYLYIDTTVSFVKEDGSDASGNYTYSPITVILKVVSSGLNVDLSGYASEYDFDPASGIILSLDGVSVKTQSGNIISAKLEAKITSSDGSTAYFTSDDNGNIVISYVPSVSKSDKYVSLKFIVTASASGYDDSTGEKIFTLNKANYDLTGIAFEDLTETYNGEAHEIAYTGTLPAGLTASVSYVGDNVNYSGRDVTATLTFDLTGQEAGGTVYYSYNLPESRTAKLTIERASVVITVYPQTAVYDKTVPVPSAEEGKDYIITEGEIFGSDDLGITLAITDADYAVGDYDLILSINNTNYILSANSSTFSIKKRVVYVKLTDEYFFKTYGDADPDWNNAVSAVTVYPSGAETGMGLAGDDAVTAINIESVSREAGENAAEYTVTVNCGESNYDVRSDFLSKFIIAPREITVILDKPAFVSVYGEALISPSADTHLKLKAGSALVGVESGKKLSEAGFKVEFVGELAEGNVTGGYYPAKTYANAVMATCSNGNYSVIFEGGSEAGYTVTKRPVWITVTPVTVEYGDPGALAFELSEIQPEKGGLARDEAADDIGITLTREGGDRPDVGKYNIDCMVEENSNYEVSVMNSPEVVYEVTAREIKIIINDAEKTYGDETPVFTWEMAEGYTMAYKEDVSVLGVALALEEGNGVNAGTYTISGTSSALGNYVVIFENATFTVHKKQAVIDVGGVKVEYVYTGEPFRITKGATHNNTDVESATSQLKYPDKEFLNVSDSNKYKITIGETDNFLAAEATITVTIKKATVVFDWSGVNGEYVYNGSEQTVTGVTINISDGTEIIYSNNTFTDVPAEGVLEVTVTVAENDNILEASETRKVTVSRATIDMSDVSFDSAEYIFDATEKEIKVSGTLPWGIEGVNYTANALTEVGTTEAVAEFVYNANNFNAVENMKATLTITQRPVAIEITSASKVFGDEDPAYTFALAAKQPCEGTDKVLAMWALNAMVARASGEDAGEYALTLTGYDRNYSVTIVSEGKLTVIPRDIVFAVTGVFQSVYDGKAKEVNVNEALIVAGGSLAPVHADIASSGAVSVSVAEGVSITNAGLYENAVIFTLIGGNYAATFEGTTENVVTADYTVTRRELTVKLLDQRLLKEESIDQNAYEITAGALVKGDTLGITILKGNELGVDRYELISEYANLNYDITFETGTLVYAVRAIITAVTPADFLYTGEPFAIDVTINSTAPLVFYVNGEYSANRFVEPGHYVVTISASADDTYREPLNVTVIFNILAPEIKHEADGAEISVSTDTGFYPEDSFDIIREQGRENSTIAEMISGEYTIVDGYVLNVSTEGGTVSLGDYLKNNYAGEEHVVRIKVPEQYASDETVECVIIRGGEASMETLDVKDGYIEISAADVEAVAFIAERETLMAVIIIAAVMSALLLAAIGYFIFRNKAY